MKKLKFWIVGSIALIINSCTEPSLQLEQVKVEQGTVQGTVEDGLRVFKGIPFVGPVPSAESLEVLDAYFRWRRSPEGAAWAK